MTTERERYLLERCLRLEVELATTRGMYIVPLLPPTPRRSLHEGPLPSHTLAPPERRILHAATPDEIAQMRMLRARGLGYEAIARQVPFCATTVRDHTMDIALEREREAA